MRDDDLRQDRTAAGLPPLSHPFDAPPAPGEALAVGEGILWARLPLPMALDHVNIYALDDGAGGWVLVDTGLMWAKGRAALAALRAGPLGGRPISRVIVTHHHPDHVGLAGDLVAEGAGLSMSRTAWLLARMLVLDVQPKATPAQIAFRRAAGVTGAALEAFAAARPFNFADCVAPLPLGVETLAEGDVVEAAGRSWRMHLGQGHAPDQVTLWSDDKIVLAADQILPGISPNIGVYPTEPRADPLAGWLASCRRFRAMVGETDPLVLPGHQRPFTGAACRLEALVDNHEHALARMLAALAEGPKTAVELFQPLYRRALGEAEFGLALAEAVAHVNHLHRRGLIESRPGPDGALFWRLT
ncbi:MAG: MBL fold metallo-hydrolase [Pseudomonadota bacterium]